MGPSMDTISALARVTNPLAYALAFREAWALLLRHWPLALAMTRRDLTTRYSGQLVGSLWIIGHPLLQMLLFVFIFGVVFSQRIESSYQLPRDYTIYILSGLVAWLSMLPVLTASCTSIISSATLVKQFTFETEVLPVKDVFTSMVFWLVGVIIIVLYTLVVDLSLPWTYLLLPAVFLMHILMMIGLAWILSSLTVFVRDIKDVTVVLAQIGVYVLPVVYLPDWVPPVFRPFIYANPFSYPIWVYQDVLYFGRIEHPAAWLVSTMLAVVLFAAGHRIFQRLKPFFGSTL